MVVFDIITNSPNCLAHCILTTQFLGICPKQSMLRGTNICISFVAIIFLRQRILTKTVFQSILTKVIALQILPFIGEYLNSANYHQPPPTTTNHNQPPPTTTNHHQPPPTATNLMRILIFNFFSFFTMAK